jgi:hypothetical protein
MRIGEKSVRPRSRRRNVLHQAARGTRIPFIDVQAIEDATLNVSEGGADLLAEVGEGHRVKAIPLRHPDLDSAS